MPYRDGNSVNSDSLYPTSKLLPENETKFTCLVSPKYRTITKNFLKAFKVFPDGMAKTYTTVANIAVYTAPGLWVLGPVLAGGAISLSAHLFDCIKNCSSNDYLKKVAKGAKLTDEVLVGYLEDLGFTWSTSTTLAVLVGWVAYDNENFNEGSAPLFTLLSGMILGGVIRYARYRHADNKRHANEKNHKPLLEIVASTFRAANSSTFITDLLQDQSILSRSSAVPSIAILATSIAGFTSGMIKSFALQISALANAYHPKLSLLINPTVLLSSAVLLDTAIEMLEDTSLAIAFFAFPNDIFAVLDKDHLKEWFFYTNMGISALYLLVLLVVTIVSTVQEVKKLLARRNKESTQGGECVHAHPEEQGLLVSNPFPPINYGREETVRKVRSANDNLKEDEYLSLLASRDKPQGYGQKEENKDLEMGESGREIESSNSQREDNGEISSSDSEKNGSGSEIQGSDSDIEQSNSEVEGSDSELEGSDDEIEGSGSDRESRFISFQQKIAKNTLFQDDNAIKTSISSGKGQAFEKKYGSV